MLPTDALNTLNALSLNEKSPLTPDPGKDPSGKGAFEVGQRVQGTILSQVSSGVFKVRVLEQMINMPLPENLKSGDVVELQVMSLQPRITFSLAGLNQPMSTPESLSNTALLLASLAQKPHEKAQIRALRNEPLVSETSRSAPDTSALAAKLHDSLSRSGLFYEAHQAQWISGTRSTAQLLQEPQNQLAAASKAAESAGTATTSSHQQQALSSIPQQLHPLVQQQLNALETRQVLWHGFAWPNQQMDWEIHEEPPRQGSAGYEESGKQWATQLRMELPNLGEIAVMLRFSNKGLSITLDAAGEKTRALFGSSSSQLTAALAERGIPVSSTLVAPHGKN